MHAIDQRSIDEFKELQLTQGCSTQHLRPGGTFELGHSVPHAERYGGEGAVYWAARKVRA